MNRSNLLVRVQNGGQDSIPMAGTQLGLRIEAGAARLLAD